MAARLSRWLRRDYDGVITLVVIAVVLVLEYLNVQPAPDLNQAILLVLGLLAVTILRERHRDEQADRRSQTVQLLNSVEIRRELEEARRRTDHWTFKGGTGTYLRAKTLPECVRFAEQERRNLRIQVEIIDPTNDALCEYYARYRHSGPDSTGEQWTRARTRNEAYATILAACWYLQRHASLRMDVALSSSVSTFRWDVSSQRAFVTQEDPSPHLMFTEPSPHYNFCTRELDSSFRQARRVPLEQKAIELSDDPTVDEARCLFLELGLGLPRSVTDQDVADIVRKALHARNPYP